MPTRGRFADKLKRSAHLGVALLQATASRPAAPLKLNLCLTYWCQYKCKTCNIWQRKPTDELTTDEVIAIVRENPHITWADLTGGEIFLRPDIDDILEAVVTGWRRLALLHFPTNGFLTDRIVAGVERIAGRGPANTVVTVSLDGDEETNDEIRGIKGGFRRQIETFNALRRIPGIVTRLRGDAVGLQPRTVRADLRRVRPRMPGLTIDDVHLNVAQMSGHYYGNDGLDAMRPDPVKVRAELEEYRRLRGRPRSPKQLLENAYLGYLDKFLLTGTDADAVPRASRELLHRSVGRRLSLHHLLEADRPPARHGHAAGSHLECRRDHADVQREIWKDSARSAGPPARRIRASSATSSLGAVRSRGLMDRHADSRGDPRLRGRGLSDERHLLHRRRDSGSPGQGGGASRGQRRVGGDRREAGSAEHRRRHRSDAPLRRRGLSSSSDTRPTARRSSRRNAVRACSRTAGAEKARRSAAPSRTSARRSPCSWTPTDRTIRKTSRCWSSRSLPTGPTTSPRRGCRGGSSELHGGFDEFFRLAGSSFITACINWRFNCRLSDSQNGFRAIRTTVLRQLDLRENHHHDRAGDDHQDAAARIADGRSAEPRAPAVARHRRISASGAARRATAVRWSSICSSDGLFQCEAYNTVNVLGIWDGHDSGAALLQDGRLRFAVNEERLTRRKLEVRFPTRSIEACLAYAGLEPGADRRRRGLDLRSGQDARALVARKQGTLLRGPSPQGPPRAACRHSRAR